MLGLGKNRARIGTYQRGMEVKKLEKKFKRRDYEGTNIAREEAVKDARTQLNDALIDSYPDSRFCQFYMGWDPFWAWVCCVLDRQDAIKELFN